MIFLYSENLGEATQIARAALPMASKLNLPANPLNYAVLYTYLAGNNSGLKMALDRLRLKPDRLTEENIYSLYRDYIYKGDEQVMNDLRGSLGTILDTMQDSIQYMDSESHKYESDLGADVEGLEDVQDQTGLMAITRRLIKETRNMQKVSKLMNKELANVSAELVQLREDYQRVCNESLQDPVTGTNNRRAFDYAIAAMCEASDTEAKPLSLLMVDMDHFKKVNDIHGHVVGDAVLKWMAQLINEAVRGGDFLARYGGEEFAVVLQDTSLKDAEKVAENIRRRTEGQKLKYSELKQKIDCVTVSIGVACYHTGEPTESLVERADDALYHAKESGRNRICSSTVAKNNVARNSCCIKQVISDRLQEYS